MGGSLHFELNTPTTRQINVHNAYIADDVLIKPLIGGREQRVLLLTVQFKTSGEKGMVEKSNFGPVIFFNPLKI